jgi:hypothetical protein
VRAGSCCCWSGWSLYTLLALYTSCMECRCADTSALSSLQVFSLLTHSVVPCTCSAVTATCAGHMTRSSAAFSGSASGFAYFDMKPKQLLQLPAVLIKLMLCLCVCLTVAIWSSCSFHGNPSRCWSWPAVLISTVAIHAAAAAAAAQDDAVPVSVSQRLFAQLPNPFMSLTLVKDGDHRLARPGDMLLMLSTLDTLVQQCCAQGSCCQ